jgi:small multidrug resistance pump
VADDLPDRRAGLARPGALRGADTVTRLSVDATQNLSKGGLAMPWLLLTAAIALEVAATLSLKASDGLTKLIWAFPVAIGYLGAFVLLAQVLRLGMPVGVAYAVWAAAGIILTAILGSVLFAEPLTWTMAAGIVLISLGVILVETGGGHA